MKLEVFRGGKILFESIEGITKSGLTESINFKNPLEVDIEKIDKISDPEFYDDPDFSDDEKESSTWRILNTRYNLNAWDYTILGLFEAMIFQIEIEYNHIYFDDVKVTDNYKKILDRIKNELLGEDGITHVKKKTIFDWIKEKLHPKVSYYYPIDFKSASIIMKNMKALEDKDDITLAQFLKPLYLKVFYSYVKKEWFLICKERSLTIHENTLDECFESFSRSIIAIK